MSDEKSMRVLPARPLVVRDHDHAVGGLASVQSRGGMRLDIDRSDIVRVDIDILSPPSLPAPLWMSEDLAEGVPLVEKEKSPPSAHHLSHTAAGSNGWIC